MNKRAAIAHELWNYYNGELDRFNAIPIDVVLGLIDAGVVLAKEMNE
jgi:hypothetical protein